MKTKICFILACAFCVYAMADTGAATVKTKIGERAALLQSV